MLVSTAMVALPGLGLGYWFARSFLVQQAFERISFATSTVEESFGDWMLSVNQEARFLFSTSDWKKAAQERDSAWLRRLVSSRSWIKSAFLISRPGGRVVASSDLWPEQAYVNLSDVYLKGALEFTVTRVYTFPFDLEPTISIAAPVNPTTVGVLNLQLNRISDYSGAGNNLSKGAKIYLVNTSGELVTATDIGTKEFPRGLHSEAVGQVTRQQSGSGTYLDYRGTSVFGQWRWLPEVGLGLVVEIDEQEALSPASALALLFLAIAGAAVAVAWMLSTQLSASVTRPLEELTGVARGLAGAGAQVSWPAVTADEVGTLNTMLQLMTETFEARVDERTRDLTRTIAELEGTRNQLVASGKMAVLGSLVAGISHELNSPLGAIVSSAQSVLETVGTSWLESLSLARQQTPAQWQAFRELLSTSPRGVTFSVGSAHRHKVQGFRETLLAHGTSPSHDVLEQLADLGVDELGPELTAFLSTTGSDAVIAEAWKLASLQRSMNVIHEASQRAARVIQALRIYAHQDQGDDLVETNLERELDLLLELYFPSIKQGIEVVRQFDQLTPLWCRRDRLNQVWANLISNAIYAMKGVGRLELSVHAAGPSVVVAITDTGAGIAPADAEKVFQPFFTTKAPGEGTGLGLNISRGIVEEHGGTIAFTSVPGRTTFTVRLPLRPNTNGNRLP